MQCEAFCVLMSATGSSEGTGMAATFSRMLSQFK